MSLKNCFNNKYAWQNIKKSKGTLALFLGIVPILNSLILLLFCSNEPLSPTLEEISILNIVGLYFLPIVISLCLFQYLFKKKSVDLIGSMPISRQSIFITNTIVGIFLILGMQLINTILIYIVGSATSSVIPIAMLIDYLWIWSLSYISVFLISNIAVAISGNGITSILVTITFLCVVPFVYDYATTDFWHSTGTTNVQIECKEKECIPKKYTCHDQNCNALAKKQIYNAYAINKTEKQSFAISYNIFRQMVDSNNEINFYSKATIIKTILLSIGSSIVGLYLFKRRKLENNETSFKSDRIQALFKGLLLAPVLILFRNSLDNIILIGLMATIIVGYYFLYDLITRKKVEKFLQTIKYLVIITILIMAFIQVTDHEWKKTKSLKITSDEIESIVFKDYKISLSNEDYPVIKDKKIINSILQVILTEYPNQNVRAQDIEVQTKSRTLQFYATISEQDAQELIDQIKKSKDYQEYEKINEKDIYAYRFGTKGEVRIMTPSMRKHLDNIIKEGILTGSKTEAKYIEDILFISYTSGKQKTYKIQSNCSVELEKEMANQIRKNNLEIAKKIKERTVFFTVIRGSIEIPIPYHYFLRDMEEEWLEFTARYKKDEVNLYQDYIVLSNYGDMYFVTNRIDEVLELINKKHEQLKDDPEYQNWLNNNTYEWKVEDSMNVDA